MIESLEAVAPVRVLYIANPWKPRDVEVSEVPWRDGLTVEDCIPARLTAREALALRLNDQPCGLFATVGPGAVLTVAALPRDPITVSIGFFGTTLATFSGAAAYVALGVYAAGLIVLGRLIAKGQVPGKRRGEEESPTYGYAGQANVRSEGGPVELVYGRFRVAGTVIEEFVRNYQYPPRSDYFALVSLGEGPIQSVGGVETETPVDGALSVGDASFPTGMQINGNAAEIFTDVTVSVRLGTLEQDIVSGFEQVQQVVDVGQALESTTTTSENTTDVITSANYTGATADTHFASYGKSTSFADDYDSFKATVMFESGLSRITSAGGSQSASMTFALRYIELDGGGSPIASGGPEGDGYVRLPLTAIISGQQRSPFAIDFEFPFWDPQSYSHPTQGKALLLDRTASADYARNTSPSTPPAWTAGVEFDAWSVTFWVKSDDTAYGTNEGSVFKFSDGSSRGLEILLSRYTTFLNDRLRLRVKLGNGSTVASHYSTDDLNGGTFFDSEWTFVAVTYRKQYSGGNDRLRMVINGVTVYQEVQNYACKVPAAGTDFEVGQFVDGRIDELEFINGELTISDILQRYNSGAGRYLTAIAEHVGLWHFDVDAGGGTAADASTYANTLTFVNGASITAGAADGKIISPATTNVRKRSRYKVEIVRANTDSTHPNVADDATLQSFTGILDESLSYPGLAMVGVRATATNQINTAFPTVTQLVKGRLVPVWDGMSAQFPNFPLRWSRNPAWVACDLILKREILGRFYSPEDIDVQAFQGFADYCDELVYDKNGHFDAPTDWTDMLYAGGSGVGTVTIYFDADAFDRVAFGVGDYVGLILIPAVTIDISTADLAGWEVTAVDNVNHTVSIAISVSSDPWTSGTLLSSHTTVSGRVEGREPRHTFDGVFDVDRGAWDAIMTVLSVGRGAPIREGKRISVKWEAARDYVDIVGHGSFELDSFEVNYAGASDRPNSYVAEFHDEDRNYARTPTTLNDPELENPASLEQLRRESIFLEGITRRSAAKRHLAWLLNTNGTILRYGSFNTSFESLPWAVGEVLLCSPDLIGRGFSGRCMAQVDQKTLTIDREIVLEPATSYYAYVRNGLNGQVLRRLITSAAGTYAPGDTLAWATNMNWAPGVDDAYVVVAENEEFYIQVTGVESTADLKRKIEWVEYDASIYTDDWFEDLDDSEGGSAAFAALTAGTLPPAVADLRVEEMAVRLSGDSPVPRVRVSWAYEAEESGSAATVITGASIMAAVGSGSFEEIARVDGGARSADALLTLAAPGDTVRIAVLPIGFGGMRRAPEASHQRALRITGQSMAPAAPDDLVGRMDGELCSYSLTANEPSARHEVRRGGWILGDHVVTLAPGVLTSNPVPSWATAFGTTAAKLLARAINASGFCSATYALLEDSLTPPGARTVPSWITARNTNWAVYADGWRTASAPPAGDPVLTDFAVGGDAAAGYHLEFTGSALEATYETAYTAPAPTTPIRAFVEVWWYAVQVHPLTAEDETWAADDPRFSRWTAEGPTVVLADEAANCTLRAQIKVDEGSGLGDWQDVRCGAVYSLRDAHFRLVATRPNTDYNVKITRFVTRIRQQAFAATDTY